MLGARVNEIAWRKHTVVGGEKRKEADEVLHVTTRVGVSSLNLVFTKDRDNFCSTTCPSTGKVRASTENALTELLKIAHVTTAYGYITCYNCLFVFCLSVREGGEVLLLGSSELEENSGKPHLEAKINANLS